MIAFKMKDHPKKFNGDWLILAPIPSANEYNPMKNPGKNFHISGWFNDRVMPLTGGCVIRCIVFGIT